MIRWDTASERLGRNALPARLIDVWVDLDPEDRPQAVADAWTMPEWPEQHIDADGWLMLFDTVEYIVDGKVAARDADLPETVTLYRGATFDRRNGLSWTSSLEQARWFAERFAGTDLDTGCRVWRIDIPREFVLARFTNRREDEHVVDTSTFDDEEYLDVTDTEALTKPGAPA